MHNNSDGFSNGSRTQCTLSYNLLCLLRWLATYDAEKLKKIIHHALQSGLQQELAMLGDADASYLEEMHHGILDLFSLMETLLIESQKEISQKKTREKKLVPALDHIDASVCDESLVQNSLNKANTKKDHNPDLNLQEQLFKELLRKWKPNNKMIN